MSTLFSTQGGSPRSLHPHQERTLRFLRSAIHSGRRRPLIQLPTGAGKTVLAANIIRGALAKGKRVAFVAPALSLIDQTISAFEAEWIDCVGVVQANHPRTDPSQPVQICSAQTLARRGLPDVDIVIVDEAHEQHKAVLEWMSDPACWAVLFIGLSATPWSRGLGKHYDYLIVGARTGELIEAGFLSDFVVFAPSEPDLSGVSTVAGDFHEGELAAAVDKAALVGDVVETWTKRGDIPTLCYGVNRAHAEHLQQRFVEAGISAAYIDCFTDRADRERIFDRFRAGDVRVICNVATLSTGIDLPMTSCIIDARPTKSEMRFVQTIGRGLRTAPGKDKLLVLDHSGNHLRLGLVTDIHHAQLDNGEPRKASDRDKERSAPLPRLCSACKAVLPLRVKVCPYCGSIYEARSDIEHLDGELVQLGSRASGQHIATIAEKTQFYGELRTIARDRAYSPGWVSHKFREKFAVWPNDPRIRSAPCLPPTLKTTNWLRSRQIAFAKGRAAHG